MDKKNARSKTRVLWTSQSTVFAYFLMHLVNHDVDRSVSEIASKEENKKCFECGGQSLWASVSLGKNLEVFLRIHEHNRIHRWKLIEISILLTNVGVFLCLTHAGEHRHLGTHLSTVRYLFILNFTILFSVSRKWILFSHCYFSFEN